MHYTIRAAQNIDNVLYQLPRRERPVDTDNVPNNSAVTADPVAPSPDDLTLDPNANGPSYTKAEPEATSASFDMGLGFATMDADTAGSFYRGVDDSSESDEDDDSDSGSDVSTDGNDSPVTPAMGADPLDYLADAIEGANISEPTVAADFEMADSPTSYSGSPYGSFVSLGSTLVGSTEALYGHTFNHEKMGIFNTDDVEAIIVDDDVDYMVISDTIAMDSDVDMADAPRPKFKLTKALKRILTPAVAVPKAILTGLASKRVFTPYNALRSRSRRTMARSAEVSASPHGR